MPAARLFKHSLMNPLDHVPQFDFVDRLISQGAQVCLVGGSVRDLLLQYPSKDYDLLVRNLDFSTLINHLKQLGEVNIVGKAFGVIKFRSHQQRDQEIDISLPRIEKSTGMGHRDFEVDFSPSIPVEQDLARRDFTVNAIALDLKTGSLIDPFAGKTDLQNKILRQVFKEAFQEDPLRMIRAVQFAARFGLEIDPDTLASMLKHAPLIKTVATERIILEIHKLFLATKPSIGFDIMRQTGLLGIIFPFVEKMIGVRQPMKKNEDVYQHTMKVLDASRMAHEMQKPGDLEIMLAALLHDAGKPYTVGFDQAKNRVTFYGHQIVSARIAKKWLEKFKISTIGVDAQKVINLISNHMFETKVFYSEKAIRRFVNKVGPDKIMDLIDLRIADKKGGRFPDSMKGILNLRQRIQHEMDKKPPFGPRDLAVNGHDIINLGFKPGPIIGKIQAFLVDQVLDEPEKNNREELIRIIRENFGA